MAIIQQDPRLRDEEQLEESQGTISGTSGAPLAPEQPAPVRGTTSATQGSQQPQSASQTPRSGMATNVRQYVEKNRPQAQKMAGAVGKEITQDVSKIGQQAQQRQRALQQQLQTNQQQLDASQQFAQQQIQDILNSQQPQEGQQEQANIAPTQEEQQRFQQLLQQGVNVQTPQNFSLAPQEQRLQAMRDLGGGLQSEAGRRAALRETFGENSPYTSGQSALDELILGGTPGATQALQQQVDQTFTGAEDQLRNIQQQGRSDIKAQRQAVSGLPEEITNLLTGAEGTITGEMEQTLQDEIAQRQSVLGEDYETALQNVEAQRSKILDLAGGSKADFLSRLNQITGDLGISGGSINPEDIERIRQFEETGTVTDPRTGQVLTGDAAKEAIETQRIGIANRHAIFDELQNRLGGDAAAEALGLDKDITDFDEKKLGWFDLRGGDIFNYQDYLREQGESLDPQQLIQRQLQQETGASYEDLLSGADLQATDVATPEQIARMNALRQLAGREMAVAPESGTGEFSGADDLRELLSRYSF